MKPLISILSLLLLAALIPMQATAQYSTPEDFEVAWTLSAHENPEIFERGPAFGARSVLTGMDFDGDGNKEFLFSTDETIAAQGAGTGHLDVYLYENAGDDAYEYVWDYTHPDSSNSLPALAYGDLDDDGLWEIYFGIPTIEDDQDLFIFEQNEDGTFPDEPTATYNYERTAEQDFRPTSFAAGDFDGDGVNELATVSRTSGARELVVIEPVAGIDAFATFEIEFEAGEADLGGGAVYEVDTVDYDDDGLTEIWVNTWNNFSWTIYEATGEDTYELQADVNEAFPDNDPFSFNTNKTLFYDADDDGRLEHLAAMSSNGKLYYMDDTDDVSTITATSWTEVGTFDPSALARGADIGDIDGDGQFDIVASNGTDETVSWIEYDGSGSLTDSLSYTWTTLLDSRGGAEERYYPLRIAEDLDGDGMNEVVITNLFADEEGQDMIIIVEATVATDVEDAHELPGQVVLRQNYPNPFNPTTTIQYELKTTAPVTVRVFDSMGRLVSALVDNQTQTPGVYEVEWDGRSGTGRHVASGVYFYTLETPDFRTTRQMVLMK